MKFNINSPVKVHLTDLGKSILEHHLKSFPLRLTDTYSAYPPDEQGYTEFSLWEVGELFGHLMGEGMPLVFETEIILREQDLKN